MRFLLLYCPLAKYLFYFIVFVFVSSCFSLYLDRCSTTIIDGFSVYQWANKFNCYPNKAWPKRSLLQQMPVGINEWRAGIVRYRYCFKLHAQKHLPVFELLSSACYCVAYLYLFIFISVMTLPCSVLCTSLCSFLAVNGVDIPRAYVFLVKSELHDPIRNFVNSTSYVLATGFFLISFLFDLLKTNAHLLVKCSANQRKILVFSITNCLPY